ncbi:MAG: hypothetical protein Q9226_004133 [Calogaya cf. arnoldii]
MRKRSASALPWDPPTWDSEIWPTSEPSTAAQKTYASSEVGAVSSEEEEALYESANVTPPDSSSGEETDTSVTQDDDKPSLEATKPATPVLGAVRRDDRHTGSVIIDGAISSRSPPPEPHDDQAVRRGRTATRKAAHAQQQASYAQQQASYAPMPASTVPRQASWAQIHVPHAQSQTSLSAMAGKVSGPRGFRAFMIMDPMEEDVILNEFYSNTTNWDRADIRYCQPFWVSLVSVYFLLRWTIYISIIEAKRKPCMSKYKVYNT